MLSRGCECFAGTVACSNQSDDHCSDQSNANTVTGLKFPWPSTVSVEAPRRPTTPRVIAVPNRMIVELSVSRTLKCRRCPDVMHVACEQNKRLPWTQLGQGPIWDTDEQALDVRLGMSIQTVLAERYALVDARLLPWEENSIRPERRVKKPSCAHDGSRPTGPRRPCAYVSLGPSRAFVKHAGRAARVDSRPIRASSLRASKSHGDSSATML